MSVTVGDRVQDVGFSELLVQDSVFRFEGFGWGSQGLRVQDVKLGFRRVEEFSFEALELRV